MMNILSEKKIFSWQSLPKPFFALAPMAGVTDTVFRQIIARHGKPDVFWTEFAPADGFVARGKKAVAQDLSFTEGEYPIVAQIFGATPKHFFEMAKYVAKLGFDGIDINMGCPDKAVLLQGAGAPLIRNPSLARDIILATREGLASVGSHIPVSVKTRTGFNVDELDIWIPILLEAKIDALTIHARTKKELSDVPARWEDVARVVALAKGTGTIIIGNGDVRDLADARAKAEASGADGVMLGRAIFGNPWLFRKDGYIPTVREKLEALVDHANLYTEVWGDTKPFDLMKKHCKAYVSGFPHASDLRARLMECDDAKSLGNSVREFLAKNY